MGLFGRFMSRSPMGRMRTFVGGTRTGRAGKMVNSARRRKCAMRKAGTGRVYGNTRGFMLQEIYRVPGQWMNQYGHYTNANARADLDGCASVGVLPHSSKVVRYDKLGIRSANNAVQYALQRVHGMGRGSVKRFMKEQKYSPYTSYAALRNIAGMRQGTGARYEFMPFHGIVRNTKRGTPLLPGFHQGPASGYRYNYRRVHNTKAYQNSKQNPWRLTPNAPAYLNPARQGVPPPAAAAKKANSPYAQMLARMVMAQAALSAARPQAARGAPPVLRPSPFNQPAAASPQRTEAAARAAAAAEARAAAAAAGTMPGMGTRLPSRMPSRTSSSGSTGGRPGTPNRTANRR